MSHLKNLDMDEFICYSEREYVEKAVEYTKKERSEYLPQLIRENMKLSHLMDYEGFAHSFNAACWEVWK